VSSANNPTEVAQLNKLKGLGPIKIQEGKEEMLLLLEG